jgi:glucosamine--fructose-6-phosphate aminotransferase (isomerizing)
MTSRMLAEIAEGPNVVQTLLADADDAIGAVKSAVNLRPPRMVVMIGRGSSAFAGLYGRYLVETLLGLPVVAASPAVSSVYGRTVPYDGALVIALSQGGRSPDILAATQQARRSAALTVAIVNDTGSPLAALADLVIPIGAGPEGVTATKSYVAELAALAAVIVGWAGRDDLVAALAGAPVALAATIDVASTWLDMHPGLTAAMARADRAQVVSRGLSLATALEVAVKLTETTGLLVQGYSASDFRHGYAVAAGPDVPLLGFRPDGPAGPSVDEALADGAARGAVAWVVGGPSVRGRPRALALDHGLPPEIAPLVEVAPGQLLAERVARARGMDPDRPPGLQKVILTT